MSVQTGYNRNFAGAKPGTESDQARCYRRDVLNKTGADLDVGVALVQDSSGDSWADLPTDASMSLIGVSINDMGRNPNGLVTGAYGQNKMAPTVYKGPVFVQADQIATPHDPVYVRYAASGNGQLGAVGSFRKDGDGVAAVWTLTPTAANATVYAVDVFTARRAFHFEVTSSGSATATTITTQFKTAMAADKRFSKYVTASGTATLILTATLQNEPMTVAFASTNAGTIAAVYTTPFSGTARFCPGLRWLSTGTGGASGVGEIQFEAEA